jgi:hypothetical protein
MSCSDTYTLTTVVWTTSANSDNKVALFFAEHLQTIKDVGVFRVWLNSIKYHNFNAGCAQMAHGLVDCAIFNSAQTFIGDQKGFFPPNSLQRSPTTEIAFGPKSSRLAPGNQTYDSS